ncbi:MAG: cytochrome P450, partial [Limnospira maxima]
EPKKFRPERFLERRFSPYEYFPFGGGSRSCIGMALSLFEIPRQRINDFLRGRVDTRSDLIEKYIQALTPKQRMAVYELYINFLWSLIKAQVDL